jgi:hypothetical protein
MIGAGFTVSVGLETNRKFAALLNNDVGSQGAKRRERNWHLALVVGQSIDLGQKDHMEVPKGFRQTSVIL